MQWNNPFKSANIFQKSEFARNSLTLTSGIAVAQVLPLLFYPILGRIFSPEDFGLQATLFAITTILATLSSCKYEGSIILSESKEEAANIATLCIIMSFAILTISYFLLQFALCPILSDLLQEPRLNSIIFICPLTAFAIVIFSVYNEWCIRNKYFKKLSVNKIVNSGAIVLSETTMGLAKTNSFGLIIGETIGRWISALGCIIRCWHDDSRTFSKVELAELPKLAKKYIEFPKYTMTGDLLNLIGVRFPALFLILFFCGREVGFFSMAMTIVAIPITIISSAIRDVFKQRASEEFKEKGNCISIFKKTFRIAAITGIIGYASIVCFLPSLFEIVLGDQWTTAGEYSQIVGVAVIFSFVSIPLNGVFIVAKKLKAYLIWQIYYATTTIISIIVGALVFKDMTGTLIIFTSLRASAYILSIVMTFIFAKGQTSTRL